MIVNSSRGLGCNSCGGSFVEEGLAGILGDTIYQEEEAAQNAQVEAQNAYEAQNQAEMEQAQIAQEQAQQTLNNTYQGSSNPQVASVIQAIAPTPVPIPVIAPVVQPVQAAPILVPNLVTAASVTPIISSGVVPAVVNTAPATPSQSSQQAQTTVGTGTINTPVVVPATTQVVSDNPFMDWLGLSSTPSPSLIGGIPNWLLALGGIGAIAFFGGKHE
jgi:hypothetical protein